MTWLKDWRVGYFGWVPRREYTLKAWVLNWGYYGCCAYVRILGFGLNIYRDSSVIEEDRA